MHGFNANIEQEAIGNTDFRKVVYTGKHSQLVLMSLLPSEDIGLETHNDNDQFFRFESGRGEVHVDDTVYTVGPTSVIIVPAGAEHNIINLSESEPLKMYTMYSPAHHKDGTVHVTKADAQTDLEQFDGVTTE